MSLEIHFQLKEADLPLIPYFSGQKDEAGSSRCRDLGHGRQDKDSSFLARVSKQGKGNGCGIEGRHMPD